MAKIKIKGRFSYPASKGRSFDDGTPLNKSRVKPEFSKEADMNAIIRKYKRTGLLSDPNSVTERRAIFADVSGAMGYQAMQNRVIAVQGLFDGLPAAIRDRFRNDPAEFVDFVCNEANKDEVEKLGIFGPVENNIAPEAPQGGPEGALNGSKPAVPPASGGTV